MVIGVVYFPFNSNFSKQHFGECISHNGSFFFFFWKEAANKMNSFAFHELQVRSFFTPPPWRVHIPQICLPSRHMSYWWSSTECYSITQMAQRNSHTRHLSQQTVQHFVFSSVSLPPRSIQQHKGELIPDGFVFFGISYVAVLGFQASFTACGSMCGPFLCQQCHVFPTGTKRHKLHYYLCNTI